MPDNFPILSLITFSPLLGVLVLLFMPKRNGRAIKWIGIVTTLLPLALVCWLYSAFQPSSGSMQFLESLQWIKIPLNMEGFSAYAQVSHYYFEFRYSLGVDGLSLPLVFLTVLLSTMAALASLQIKKRWKLYFILFLLLEMSMLGVFMAQDLFLFFLFFELGLVPVFFLVGIWGFMNREKAAIKFLIYNGAGSAVMLLAFLMLIATAGFTMEPGKLGYTLYFTSDLQMIMHNLFHNANALVHSPSTAKDFNPFYLSPRMHWMLFLMLIAAFGIKLPIFPFHTWMLKVHTEAPTPIVMIHSGILLKMGAYGLLRFGILLLPGEAKSWATALAILGVINILYGAALAFVQRDFKLILAYSSISHMGIVLLGFAAFNEIGMEGAVFQLLSHGLISALMFLIVGCLYERTNTSMIHEMGGLAKQIPFISGVLLIAGLASLGLPALSGFVGELMAYMGLFHTHMALTIIGALGLVLAAVYVLRGVLKITFGSPLRTTGTVMDARLAEAVPMIILVAFIVLLGVFPSVAVDPMQHTLSGFSSFIQNFSTKVGG